MEFGAYLSTLTHTPPTPKPQPPAQGKAGSLFFVILHKSAAIKMHWSRTALGRDGLAFPGQRPVSLPIHWRLFFFKVNAFSLEWEGAAFEAVGVGVGERQHPPFSFPLLL